MLNREQKSALIQSMKREFAESPAAFLVSYKGIDVAQLQALRRGLRDKGGRLQIAKMRLIKRAIADVDGLSNLAPMLKEQLGVVFAANEPTAVAKMLHDFSKECTQLGIVGGCMDAHVLNKKDVIAIATLPSRDVLLAQLCGVLNAPMRNCAGALQAIIAQLAYGVKAVADKKAQSE